MSNENNNGVIGTYVLIVLQVILLVTNHVLMWNLPLYILLLPGIILVVFMLIGLYALSVVKKNLDKLLDDDVN